MTNSNILGPQQQQPLLYNNPNPAFHQNPTMQSNNFSYPNIGYGINNQFGGVGPNRFSTQIGNFNTQQGPQTSNWGGYNNVNQFGNVNNRQNVNVLNEQPSQKNPVENYVTRAFEKCQNEKDRQLTEKALKKILNNAKLRGDYETRDWDSFPLPTISQDQRFGAAANVFGIDKMETESYDKDRAEMTGPIKVGSLLQKRGFKNINQESSGMEIGMNDKGKKVIKTMNKAANKAKLVKKNWND